MSAPNSNNESIEATTRLIVAAPTADPIDQKAVLGKDHAEDDLLKFDDEAVVQESAKEQSKAVTVKAAEITQKQLQLVPLELPKMTSNCSSSSLVEVPLHESSDEELGDLEDCGMGRDLEDDEVDEEEHADHLSPLMLDNHTMDNHTIVEHLECYQSDSPTIEMIAPVMVVDSAGNITIMKHSDTRDSLSSLDSDLCMSFDRQLLPLTSTEDSPGNSSSENDHARDSGCETGTSIPSRPYCPVEADESVIPSADIDELPIDESKPFEIPDEEFSEKIVEQVEFYFSNESILKDAFLLKHVRRNKEGYVSLKLVSSFKRVRQLTKDWRVVGHAIKLKSKTVELNDVGTKVRRIDALPNYDETMPSRTVVATDLALEKITIEKAYEMFSKCGEIALVRILRVGGPIPADVRQFINKYPELLQKECALVEFVESRSARNALAYEGITVLEMVAPKKKTGKKAHMTRMVSESHVQPSMMMFGGERSMDQERSRGGAPLENSAPPRFQMRRAASGYYTKPDQVMYVPPPRKFGYNHGSNFAFNSAPPSQGFASNNVSSTAGHHHHQNNNQFSYSPPQQAQHLIGHHHHNNNNQQQHYQVVQHAPQSPPSPPDTYEVYRRTSAGHIVAVTSSPTNKFNPERRYEPAVTIVAPEMRRGSQPQNELGPRKMHAQQPLSVAVAAPQPMYECQCNCQSTATTQQQRRLSVASSNGNEMIYHRRMSSSSNGGMDSPRKLSTTSGGAFERKVSVTETNWRNEAPPAERKYSTDQMLSTTTTVQYHQPLTQQQYQPDSPIRKYSNGFDPLRKLSNADEYINGRRISTDSGYDRKYSFSSDCSNHTRSRSNSFICNHAPVVEQIIRAPTGPAGDGSRGFNNRTRKIGQILPPI